MKSIVPTLLILLLGGCSVQQSVPSVTEYRLKPIVEKVKRDATSCRDKTLRIALTQSPLLMQRPAIFYADDKHVQYSYSRSRWIESPDKQWRHLLEEELGRQGLFSSVITYNSQAYNDWLLESKITDFMQYFEADRSYVRLVIQLTLIDQDTRKVVATHMVDTRLDTSTSDAKGAVEAFNRAVSQALKEIVEWLDGNCN